MGRQDDDVERRKCASTESWRHRNRVVLSRSSIPLISRPPPRSMRSTTTDVLPSLPQRGKCAYTARKQVSVESLAPPSINFPSVSQIDALNDHRYPSLDPHLTRPLLHTERRSSLALIAHSHLIGFCRTTCSTCPVLSLILTDRQETWFARSFLCYVLFEPIIGCGLIPLADAGKEPFREGENQDCGVWVWVCQLQLADAK